MEENSSKLMNYSRNISTIFLVRPLGICEKSESLNPKDSNAAKIITKYGFVEAYLRDSDFSVRIKRPVFCLFKPDNLQDFNDFIESEKKEGAEIIDEYDYPGGYVVVVYKFPEVYNKDYDLIIEGKYSRTSRSFKSLFPMVKGANGLTLYSLVLAKEPKMIKRVEDELQVKFDNDMEFWHLVNWDKETLNAENLK